MLKFREDTDLSVLALSGHKDLEKLARVLTHDTSDGEKRHAQELLGDPSYKEAIQKGDLRLAWKSIAAELQAYGGDSVINAVRSLTKGYTGVTYREIVADICERLKLQFKPSDDIKGLEDQLLVGLILSQKDKFHAEDLAKIMEEVARGVGLDASLQQDLKYDELIKRITTDAKTSYLASLVAPAIASAAFPFLTGLTLPIVLEVVASRLGGLVFPMVGTVAAVASTMTLVTSPAFRVTLPAVLEVIRIRRVVLLSPMNEDNEV